MKILTAASNKNWIETTPAVGGTQTDEQKKHENDFRQHLLDVLMAENLIVFTGLGCSLSVNKKVANTSPSMIDLWNAVESKVTSAKFKTIITKVKYSRPANGDNIEMLLSRCQAAEKYSSDPDVKQFIEDAEKIIIQKCNFVTDTLNLDYHESFLRKIARRSTNKPRLKLFTTNYDLIFEEAAKRNKATIIDGFSNTEPREFDGSYFNYDLVKRERLSNDLELVSNLFHLYKIHGSMDWERTPSAIIKRKSPTKPLIIYPRDTKYELSYDQPFLEIMARFQSNLREANSSLLIIGFGFNDMHLAEPILSAVKSNVSLKILIVDPILEASTNTYIDKIRNLVSEGDWRISLIETSFDEFVQLVPDLQKESEQELFSKKLKKAGII